MNGASSTKKDTRFSKDNQPDQRGDPKENGKGNAKRLIMTDALMISLNRVVDDIVDGDGKPTKKLSLIADKLTEKAAEGDIQAIKEIFDRTQGKAAQAITLEGNPEKPLTHQFLFNPVGAGDESNTN